MELDNKTIAILVLLICGTIFFLGQVLVVPSGGSNPRDRKRLQQRMEDLDTGSETAQLPINLLRERFRRNPSRLDAFLGRIPGMRELARSLEVHGQPHSGYTVIMISLALVMTGAALGWYFTKNLFWGLAFAAALGSLPIVHLRMQLNRRFELFEEQLVGAIDIMIRALRAGYPFVETLRHVARELDDPVAIEFRLTFDEINGGVDVRAALYNLLNRVPSLSLMALTTTVLLQRETGGNLAESLEKISGVIRGRFKFQRNIKTLTAEGRMTAWVLALLPFAIFILMLIMAPTIMLEFIHDPDGQDMIMFGLGMMALGVLWLRKLLDLDI
ncbi:MAG: type II secretion system F family protein [Methylococcus sp.]